MKVLVTGAAGFIGMHVCERLLARGDEVTGLDNLNDYYDPTLKQDRVERLASHANFRFEAVDIADQAPLDALFAAGSFDRVVHLAAQAGVRYSLRNPQVYVQSNLVGFANILEACRHARIAHLVYASSSSVYGGNVKQPFAETDPVDHPVSLYAATKKSNELSAHVYSHLFGLPTTGLRFFTVYGPWGRPDMACSLFAKAIMEGVPIDVFNQGQMSRDFTYIDDVTEAVVRVLDKAPTADDANDTRNNAPSAAPARIFNIGNRTPVPLMEFIATLEQQLGRTARKNLLPMQAGDVASTCADTSAIEAWVGFQPATPLEDGLKQFTDWFVAYYGKRFARS
ncbi:NAD-dependent epimerase [Caenimonas koreensis]|uniref:NAD-dependent epimerase/dehydratase family protein n=1 Tax=Caenimonas koreensis DSM 17982 TaxID=1121255 RepID=A0A844ASG1_9BURK|nr:NAD-dependent epimerase [Caenimonas koreensis]MRD47255.1 NAD-dependent epimerase/dehydratase family protein [Caenimonas koreensis DSM 17982]